MTLLVGLCGLLVYGASMMAGVRYARQAAKAEMERLSTLVVSSVQALLREPETALELAAALMGEGAEHQEATLDGIRITSPYLRTISLIDAEGRVTRSSSSGLSILGADLSGSAYLRALRAEPGLHWSSIYAGIDEGRREISLGMARGNGALIANIDFEELSLRLEALLEGADLGLSLVDGGAGYITHGDRGKVDRRETEQELIGERIKLPNAARYSYIKQSPSGPVSVIAAQVPETGWFALVERPESLAFESFRTSLPLVSVLAVAVILAASAFSLLASRSLLSDVRAAGGEYDDAEAGSSAKDYPVELNFRETDAIRRAARAAAIRMRAKDAANERLEALNVRLAQTLDELSRAQEALLESERLAVQGTMAAAMAHELNTPIAAADSAASAAASAAGDILGYVAKNPSWDPKASAAAAALQEAADGYDPARALTGPDRRSATRSMEKALASALSGLKKSEDKLEELEPVVLASRLVDLGVSAAGGKSAASIIGAFCSDRPEAALSCLSAAEIIASCRVARAAMAKAHAVVGSIKAYAEPEEEPGRRPLSLSAMIEEVLGLLYIRTKKGVDLSLAIEADIWIKAEPGNVQRMLLILLSNALDAMGYRGKLGLRLSASSDRALLQVEDSGPSIAAELMSELWKPEFLARNKGRRGGINLSPVKELVNAMGGDIKCASAPGRTIFTVSIPRHT
jgi:signal transduction histidine kinase